MKSLAIALSIVYLIFTIGSNELSSSNNIALKEKRESYMACIRLKIKAPNLNLNCENLLENFPFQETENVNDSNLRTPGVKILSTDEAVTRKVNKSEELKLRNLIKKLSSENKLRRD